MTIKRFKSINCGLQGQYIKDDGVVLTIDEVVELLNELHEENEDRFNEQMHLQKQLHNTQKELEPIRKICKKYRIPIKDLPEILEEYIAYDNDDEW